LDDVFAAETSSVFAYSVSSGGFSKDGRPKTSEQTEAQANWTPWRAGVPACLRTDFVPKSARPVTLKGERTKTLKTNPNPNPGPLPPPSLS